MFQKNKLFGGLTVSALHQVCSDYFAAEYLHLFPLVSINVCGSKPD